MATTIMRYKIIKTLLFNDRNMVRKILKDFFPKSEVIQNTVTYISPNKEQNYK